MAKRGNRRSRLRAAAASVATIRMGAKDWSSSRAAKEARRSWHGAKRSRLLGQYPAA